ncbi:MAG: hypothetical protein FWE45_00710 [Firmicutes bacterium]|nr:hypothetical protein [Bacillota bacterium]
MSDDKIIPFPIQTQNIKKEYLNPEQKVKDDIIFKMSTYFWPTLFIENEYPNIYSILMGDTNLFKTKIGNEIKEQYEPQKSLDITSQSRADFNIHSLIVLAEFIDGSGLVWDIKNKVFRRYTHSVFKKYHEEVGNKNQTIWNNFAKWTAANVDLVLSNQRKWRDGEKFEASLERPAPIGLVVESLEIIEI